LIEEHTVGSGWRKREPQVIGSKHAHNSASEKGKSFQVFQWKILKYSQCKDAIPLKNKKLPPFSTEKRDKFRYFFRK
jgi:hypothetical protein